MYNLCAYAYNIMCINIYFQHCNSRTHLVAHIHRPDERRRFIIDWVLLYTFISNKVWAETLQLYRFSIRISDGLRVLWTTDDSTMDNYVHLDNNNIIMSYMGCIIPIMKVLNSRYCQPRQWSTGQSYTYARTPIKRTYLYCSPNIFRSIRHT